MKATLALESGRVFVGRSFGVEGEASGEVVFNTSLTGYQEVFTDPSYKGQIVVMTYPHIGNTGMNSQDDESRKAFLEAVVVREASPISSNWRCQESLEAFMKRHKLLGIDQIDTRALTRHLREKGAMRGILATGEKSSQKLVMKAKTSPSLGGQNLVSSVTGPARYEWKESLWNHAPGHAPRGQHRTVVVLDCGIKYNTLRCLVDRGCRVVVVPATTSAKEILVALPDGIVLSNGPGDPEAVSPVIKTVRQLIDPSSLREGKSVPLFGICLGHQILALALGGKTYKLKFGHHGINHPVKDLVTGRVEITSQNHGFCVDADSLEQNVEITHLNLNDNTVEGMRHKKLPIFSVQYHPEAGPGPQDSRYLFDRFVELMDKNK